MPIATTDAVKMALGIDIDADDEFIGELQTAADAFISGHCGRAFTGGTFTEYHPAGGRTLFLANYPVTAVTSVKVDAAGTFGADSLRTADTYAVLADRGVIAARGGAFGSAGDGPTAVQVVYTTATGAVPPPVSRAYAELIGVWYRQAKTADHLGQLNLVSRNESGVETAYSNGFEVPPTVTQMLALYRTPAM